MSPSSNRKPKTYTNAGRARKRKLTFVAVIAAIIIVAAVAFILLNQPSSQNNVNPSPTPTATPTPSPTPTPYYDSSAAPLSTPAGEYSATGTRVLFVTSVGNITLQMRDDKTTTVANFVKLVKQGFYDETTFHRVIVNFMIQGGQNTTVNAASIPDEIGNDNHNYAGTIAMANTGAPNSASSEFFINTVDNSGAQFDGSYTVFGQVIGGMDVALNISRVPCQQNPQMPNENSVPITPVFLVKAVVLS